MKCMAELKLGSATRFETVRLLNLFVQHFRQSADKMHSKMHPKPSIKNSFNNNLVTWLNPFLGPLLDTTDVH